MKNTKSIFVFVLAVFGLLLSACGPTYVVDGTQQGYVEPIYNPGLSVVYMGGQQGYYDTLHIFHPMIVVGGSQGYYDTQHHFVSSAPAVREAVQNHKPIYTGSSNASVGQQSAPQRATDPNGYGNGSGMGRGPSAGPGAQQAAPVTGKPNYGAAPGTASVGQSTRTAPPPQAAPMGKPSYGSVGSANVGQSTRTAPAAAAPRSFSPSPASSGMGRTSSPSPSSSGMGRSRR